MRKELLHIQQALEKGARNVAERHFNPASKNNALGISHLGNEHIALPAFLIIDPILEPIDKSVYSTIRFLSPQSISANESAYPTYDEICKFTNIGSHATVARALAILRMTRWLVSKQVRTQGGTMANVYMTMDHPLDFADMNVFDKEYLNYLSDQTKHNHNRVCHVAQIMLVQHENDLLSGKDTTIASHPIEQILEAKEYINGNPEASYFGCDRGLIDNLKDTRYQKSPSSNIKDPTNPPSLNIEERFEDKTSLKIEEPDLISSLNSEEHCEDKPSLNIEEPDLISSLTSEERIPTSSLNIEEPSSSSSLNITTTTNRANRAFYVHTEADKDLRELIKQRFDTLSPEQQHRIGRLLMRINLEDRETMVYEVSNRIRFGNKAIPNPIGYIGSLCGLLKKGEFPFTEYGFEDFKQNTMPIKQVNPISALQTKLNVINHDLSTHWADLMSFENMQKTTPNEINAKSIERVKTKLRELSQQKRNIEESMNEFSLNQKS